MIRGQSYWVPLMLFGAAGLLALDPVPFRSPLSPATEVQAWVTDPTPVRQPALRPVYVAAGYTYQCSDCHRIIPSPAETLRVLTQHREIALQHGLNARCFNCHHRTERDAFVDDLGEAIPWGEPQRLCARCHGPVFRDWEHGSHGRINGHWDITQGAQTRRKCIECHDPHHPAFPPLAPAPGPNTLRMGRQEAPPHSGGHDPLRIYARDQAGSKEP